MYLYHEHNKQAAPLNHEHSNLVAAPGILTSVGYWTYDPVIQLLYQSQLSFEFHSLSLLIE
jgi:hypothetical protein